MTQRRKILEYWLCDSYYYLLIYIVSSSAKVLVKGDIGQALILLPTYFLFGLMFFISRYINNFFIYIGINAVLIGIYYIISGGQLLTPVALFIYYVYTTGGQNRQRDINMGTLGISMTILTLIYSLYYRLGVDTMNNVFYIEAILLIAITMVYKHLKSINFELEIATAGSVQPVSEILKFNNMVIIMLTGIMSIVLGVFRFNIIGDILKAIGRGIAWILSLILGGIEPGEEIIKESIYSPSIGNSVILGEIEKSGGIRDIIEKILIYAVNIGIIAIILIVIATIILKYYRGFKKNDRVLVEREFIKPQIIKEKSIRSLFNILNVENRIRRKFYNRVNKYFKRGELKLSDTPIEMADKLSDKEKLTELIEDYEAVRYGKNG